MTHSPESLLTMTTTEALYVMAQDWLNENRPGIKSEWYRAGDVESIGPARVRVEFVLDRARTPVDKWDSPIGFGIEYERLNIMDMVEFGTAVNAHTPASHLSLMTSALGRYGIPVEPDEVKAGTANAILAEIHMDSYRWFGHTTVVVEPFQYRIEQLVKQNNIVTNFSSNYNSLSIRHDIVKHINHHNVNRLPIPLTLGDVSIGLPIEHRSHRKALNTKIRITANSSTYEGEEYIYYHRKSFTETLNKPVEIEWTESVTTHDLLDELSERFHCLIRDDDVIDEAIEDPKLGQPTDVMVRFNPETLAYVDFIRCKLIRKVDDTPDPDPETETFFTNVYMTEYRDEWWWSRLFAELGGEAILDMQFRALFRNIEMDENQPDDNSITFKFGGNIPADFADKVVEVTFNGLPAEFVEVYTGRDAFPGEFHATFRMTSPAPKVEGAYPVTFTYKV